MSGNGTVRYIFTAPPRRDDGTRAPMRSRQEVRAIAGHGLEGDRYCTGQGSYSRGRPERRQVTFMSVEALVDTCFLEADTRRNIFVADVDLAWLVGRFFRVGKVLFYGVKYCDPCPIPEQMRKGDGRWPGLRRSLFREDCAERAGLVAEVIEGGMIHVGDTVHKPARSDAQPEFVWWWQLDREGNPTPFNPTRPKDAPPLLRESPYTPPFLVDGAFPGVHLHHADGRITGIHGEAEINWLRRMLSLCLAVEPRIFAELDLHPFDIPLEDVMALLLR